MSDDSQFGWRWFESAPSPSSEEVGDDMATARVFARAFAGRNGDKALTHLRAISCGRFLGPEATDAALRHLEGQRHLVAYIAALVERGRNG